MIASARNIQDTGKTAVCVGLLRYDLKFNGYVPDEAYVNYSLRIPGVHRLTNEQMVEFLKNMVKKGEKHKLIHITEIDRMFPARFWQDKEQTKALLGLWQDMKMFWKVYWDSHIGSSVDILLRETRQLAIVPHGYNKERDEIPFTIINGLYRKRVHKVLCNCSRLVFPLYDRWEGIGVES